MRGELVIWIGYWVMFIGFIGCDMMVCDTRTYISRNYPPYHIIQHQICKNHQNHASINISQQYHIIITQSHTFIHTINNNTIITYHINISINHIIVNYYNNLYPYIIYKYNIPHIISIYTYSVLYYYIILYIYIIISLSLYISISL